VEIVVVVEHDSGVPARRMQFGCAWSQVQKA